MQQALDLWNQFTEWLSTQMAMFRVSPDEAWRAFANALWRGSIWLNDGHKGLIIALVLLVLIVNRILKRQH
jgi:hypothetical protein